jgi:2-polyprenyl-3-methyl-5-hydroxy-6-metoxy-1,4-benzoquinol methylase
MNKAESSKEYFDDTGNYLNSNSIIAYRKQTISDIIGSAKNKKILDIGCGNGELTIDFLGHNRITFLDISQNMLSIVKSSIKNEYKDYAEFINSDILSYIPDKEYDIIICIGVVAHVDSIEDLILKLRNIITDKGDLIIQFTNYNNLISRFNHAKNRYLKDNPYNYQPNRINSSEMESLLKSSGFKILRRVKYLPISPFLSPFSYRNKLKILKFTSNNKLISSFCPEIILHLSTYEGNISS